MADKGVLENLQFSYWNTKFLHLDELMKKTGDNSSKLYQLRDKDNELYLFFSDRSYTLGFETPDRFSNSDLALYLHLVNTTLDAGLISNAILERFDRMPKKDAKCYDDIFERPVIRDDMHAKFPEDLIPSLFLLSDLIEQPSICIWAPVKKVPKGKEGGVSTNLFDYFRTFCFVPAYKLALQQSKSTST